MRHSDMEGSIPQLIDPESCGEDLAGNLAIAAELAPIHCGGCNGYHLRRALRRAVKGSSGLHNDRALVAKLVQQSIRAIEANGTTGIHVVIPGSGDTGLLATCAHAVASMARPPRSVIRYSVLDICETPLALCRAFGLLHELNVTTIQQDLRHVRVELNADLVILHSILSYLPASCHAGLLKTIGEWLNPNGVVIFSNRLGEERASRQESFATLAELLRKKYEAGGIPSNISLENLLAFLAAQNHTMSIAQTEFESAEEIQRLFHRAGFAETRDSELSPPVDLASSNKRFPRFVTLFSKSPS